MAATEGMAEVWKAAAEAAEREEKEMTTDETDEQIQEHGMVMRGSLRVIELQLVAFVLVVSASGLVSVLDMMTPLLLTLYLLALSAWAFPSRHKPPKNNKSASTTAGSTMMEWYLVAGSTVGLFLPVGYVLGAFARGDKVAVKEATPHLFLLCFQILTEHILSALHSFSPPVRALVPLLYTLRRVFLILDWITLSLSKPLPPPSSPLQDRFWVRFGQGLASANLFYFTVNLFCFLIPRLLPQSFEIYFRQNAQFKTAPPCSKRKKSQ